MKLRLFKEKLTKGLGSKYYPLFLLILTFLMTAPALTGGLGLDDLIHQANYSGFRQPPADGSVMGMFSFIDGNPRHTQEKMDRDGIPWWTNSHLKIKFFRPLAELTHLLDYRLWFQSPMLMHLHSNLWYLLLVLVTIYTYRHLIGTGNAASIAALLFAISSMHGSSVGWLAARYSILSTLFSIGVLVAHDQWRQKQSIPAALAASAIFLSALFIGEASLGICGFLAAYALYMDPAPWKVRILSLVPYGVIAVLWQAIYVNLDFGTAGSGSYIYPLTEPLTFIQAVFNRIPVLILGHFTGFPADLYKLLPGKQSLLTLIGYLLMACLAVFVLPVIIKRKVTRFFLLGLLLSLVPLCAGSPSERVLLLASFGGYGLLGIFFNHWFFEERPRTSQLMHGARNVFAYLLVLLHLILAPILFLAGINKITRLGAQITTDNVLNLVGPGPAQHKKLLYVNHPLPVHTSYTSYVRHKYKLEQLGFVNPLAPGSSELILTRLDSHRLQIEARSGYIQTVDRLWRNPRNFFRVGDQVQLKHMTVKILKTLPDNRPLLVEFTFREKIDHENMYFAQWKTDRFEIIKIPPPGIKLKIPPIDTLKYLLNTSGES